MAKRTVTTSKNSWVAFSVIALLVVVVILGLITYSNVSVKVFGKNLVYAVDNIFVQIPGLPKTTRGILVRTVEVNKNLTSYKMQAKLTLESGQGNFVDITTTGVVVNPGQGNSKSLSHTKGKIAAPVQAVFDFETYNSGKNLFFKVNSGPNLDWLNSKNLRGWYQLDLTEIGKDLKSDIKTETQISDSIKVEIQKYLDTEISDNKFTRKEVSRDGGKYYEIETTITRDPLSQAFLGSNEKRETKVTLLIEKSSYFLKELKLTPNEKGTVNLNLNYKITDQNKKQEVGEPKEAKKINNPVELYLLFTTGEKPTADNLLKALGGEVKEVSTTLLTIERLTKVILLLPKSF